METIIILVFSMFFAGSSLLLYKKNQKITFSRYLVNKLFTDKKKPSRKINTFHAMLKIKNINNIFEFRPIRKLISGNPNCISFKIYKMFLILDNIRDNNQT